VLVVVLIAFGRFGVVCSFFLVFLGFCFWGFRFGFGSGFGFGLACCWHPRFGIGASRVAPVPGRHLLSLPPQRK
jgi:hypothetical protein